MQHTKIDFVNFNELKQGELFGAIISEAGQRRVVRAMRIENGHYLTLGPHQLFDAENPKNKEEFNEVPKVHHPRYIQNEFQVIRFDGLTLSVDLGMDNWSPEIQVANDENVGNLFADADHKILVSVAPKGMGGVYTVQPVDLVTGCSLSQQRFEDMNLQGFREWRLVDTRQLEVAEALKALLDE